MQPVKHVIIVGGGFAGLNCARKLAGHSGLRITLVDKNNYQQFQPLLYQVAGGLLAPDNAAFSLREVLQDFANVDVKMAEVAEADLHTRTIKTAEGQSYTCDFLVLAAGAQANFFGVAGAEQHTLPLYSLHNAEMIRSHLLGIFEAAGRAPTTVPDGALNFVIVGAGPTGTEMAGTLADLFRSTLKKQYHDLDVDRARIFLIDRTNSVLSSFSQKSQTYAARILQEHGVQLLLDEAVKEIAPNEVLLTNGARIPSHNVIWAGGLKASSLSSSLGLSPGPGGRIDVQPDLSVKGFTGVYALGDFANITGADGKPLPQLASVAEQSGKWCAKNIAAQIAGHTPRPFHYLDKGIMAMIGRNAAVAELGKHRHELTGAIAFAAWLGVHVALLPSNRARFESLVEWGWDYFGRYSGDDVLDRAA
jgi:NADH:ubiquinone reductase (H+-translocating)